MTLKAITFIVVTLFGLALGFLLNMCNGATQEKSAQDRVRWLRETYEYACMTYDGNCGRFLVESSERTQCLVECIRRLDKHTQALEQKLRESQ